MKKIIAVALLSAVIAAPAFADDTSAKAGIRKAVPAKSLHHKQGKMKMSDMRMSDTDNECEQEHGMHRMGGRHGSSMMGMMGEFGDDSMMMPHMGMLMSLQLSDEQRLKVRKVFDDLKHNNWATMGLINDERTKLRDLYEADKRDPIAIGKEYQKIFDLKRQMIEASIEAENRVDEILTPEQRAQLKAEHHGMHPMHDHPMHR